MGLVIGGLVTLPIYGLGDPLVVAGLVCGAVQLSNAGHGSRGYGITLAPTPNGVRVAGRW